MIRAAVVSLVLTVSACTAGDVRDQWLVACTSYTSVVEQVGDNIEMGLYTPAQIGQIQRIEARTTPLCLKPTTYDANSLVMQALRELNVYLLMTPENPF